jgi:hypothetical protein
MWAAAVVIPLAAMAFPIVLILLAVLFDVLFLSWYAFRMWHDEWAVRVADFLLKPLRGLWHPKPVPRAH